MIFRSATIRSNIWQTATESPLCIRHMVLEIQGKENSCYLPVQGGQRSENKIMHTHAKLQTEASAKKPRLGIDSFNSHLLCYFSVPGSQR